MKITLKDAVQAMAKKNNSSNGNALFTNDGESIEFCAGNYWSINQLDSTSSENQLIENVLAIETDNTPLLITAKTVSYNGDTQVTFFAKELTLQGLYYFANKNMNPEDIENLYPAFDKFLQKAGLDFSFQEAQDLFEYNPEYNVYMFQFETDQGYVTLTAKNGMLKKISIKSGVSVKVKSAFN